MAPREQKLQHTFLGKRRWTKLAALTSASLMSIAQVQISLAKQGRPARMTQNRVRAVFHAHLPDPGYSERPFARQDETPVRRIRSIIHPTLGFPALAECGKDVTIWVTAPGLPPDKTALGNKSWKVTLRRDQTGGMELRPRVFHVERDGNLFSIHARLSADSPPDVYHLDIEGPKGFKDSQPRSVRLFCPAPRNFTIAVLSDHQLSDPTWKVYPGLKAAASWPSWGQTEDNKRITLQEFHELELVDPAFVLYAGDLVFGLDYRKEYTSMYEWWQNRRLATFMVPGNHDGYARYTLRLKGSIPEMARAVIRCRKVWPKTRSWHEIFTYLSCLYGDIKRVLFSRLVQDGLVSFARTFGPLYYSFDFGRYHFVALNTYDGTNRRRHALSLWVPFRGLKLGAPAVDNYGGYLSEKQLAWLKQDMAQAAAKGQTIVVFGHQDPRGNEQGRRYHTNDPFPTSPLGLDGFDEWDYDADWDSNPHDGRGRETTWDNSGVRLLHLLLQYASYYISGHIHEDRTRLYHPGDVVIPGMRTRRAIAFIRVTTASAGVRGHGYWGYRLLHADAEGHIDVSPYDADLGQDSVPAGRFWLKRIGTKTDVKWQLHWALSKPLHLTLPARLTFLPDKGYWFVASSRGRKPQRLSLESVAPDPGPLATYRVDLTHAVPKDNSQQERVVTIQARPARTNRPPKLIVRLLSNTRTGNEQHSGMRLDRTIEATNKGTLTVPVGKRVIIDATASFDPEHKPLIAEFIRVDRLCPARGSRPGRSGSKPKPVGPAVGRQRDTKEKGTVYESLAPCGTVLDQRTKQAAFVTDRLGVFRVRVTAYDSAGARNKMTFFIRSRPADVFIPRPGCGCCAPSTSPVLGMGGLFSILALSLAVLALFVFFRHRNPKH